MRVVVRATVVALLTLILLLSSFAVVCPSLHGAMHAGSSQGHDDSDQSPFSQHQCAITMLAKGTVELSSPGLLWTGQAAHYVFAPPVTPQIHWFNVAFRLLPERAPPA